MHLLHCKKKVEKAFTFKFCLFFGRFFCVFSTFYIYTFFTVLKQKALNFVVFSPETRLNIVRNFAYLHCKKKCHV